MLHVEPQFVAPLHGFASPAAAVEWARKEQAERERAKVDQERSESPQLSLFELED